MIFSAQGYQPCSPPDSARFERFSTPMENYLGARFATHGLEAMNLSSLFKSVFSIPVSLPYRGNGEAKTRSSPKAKAKVKLSGPFVSVMRVLGRKS